MISSSKSDGSTMAAAPAFLQATGAFESAGQRAGGGHEGRAQLKSEIGGSQAAHDCPPCRRLCVVAVCFDRSGFFRHRCARCAASCRSNASARRCRPGPAPAAARRAPGRCGSGSRKRASLPTNSRTGRTALPSPASKGWPAALSVGLVAVQGPVAATHRVLHVAHRLGHVDAVGDAGAVGDDERRSRPGVGLEQRLDGLRVVGPQRDLGHVDVAVGARDRAEVFLGRALAARRRTWRPRPREVAFEAWPPVFE